MRGSGSAASSRTSASDLHSPERFRSTREPPKLSLESFIRTGGVGLLRYLRLTGSESRGILEAVAGIGRFCGTSFWSGLRSDSLQTVVLFNISSVEPTSGVLPSWLVVVFSMVGMLGVVDVVRSTRSVGFFAEQSDWFGMVSFASDVSWAESW